MGLARQPGNQVSISYRKSGFFRIKKKNQERLVKLVRRGRIRLVMSSQVRAIAEDRVELVVTDQEGERELTLENDFVFVLIGGIPPFGLLREAGIRLGGT